VAPAVATRLRAKSRGRIIPCMVFLKVKKVRGQRQ
jgi:hypothetical protein